MKRSKKQKKRKKHPRRRMTKGETEILMAVMRANLAAIERETERLRRER